MYVKVTFWLLCRLDEREAEAESEAGPSADYCSTLERKGNSEHRLLQSWVSEPIQDAERNKLKERFWKWTRMIYVRFVHESAGALGDER